MDSHRLTESLTCRLESGLVNLAITYDDVNLATSAVGKQGNFHCALVPAHRSGRMVERFGKNDNLVEGHVEAIGECLVIKWFASLLENG
jgi:hypothetical protein